MQSPHSWTSQEGGEAHAEAKGPGQGQTGYRVGGHGEDSWLSP